MQVNNWMRFLMKKQWSFLKMERKLKTSLCKKKKRQREREGWLAHPDLLRTPLVLALKAPYPGNPPHQVPDKQEWLITLPGEFKHQKKQRFLEAGEAVWAHSSPASIWLSSSTSLFSRSPPAFLIAFTLGDRKKYKPQLTLDLSQRTRKLSY